MFCNHNFVDAGGPNIDGASFCGEKIRGKHVRFCDDRRDGGVNLEDTMRPDGVGLGGGNGTSKVE